MKLMDDMRRRDQLLDWTEQGLLSREQLQRALAPERPQPAARHWLTALDRVLAFYGCLLLALGVLFFFAFNWEELHRFTKLALAAAALSGFAGIALLMPRESVVGRATLMGAALATGGLLALIGQTYQTGADIWQLFAVWTVLSLPWALLSRSAACWVLFWLVANLALVRYFASTGSWLFGGLHGVSPGLLSLAAFNALLLVLFECWGGRLLLQPSRLLPRLAGCGALAALGLGAMIAWWRPGLGHLLLILAAIYLVGIPIYRRFRPDLLLLAMQLYSLVAVLTAGLARLLQDIDDFALVWLLGLFVLLGSAMVSVWLQRCYREDQQ
ncbi:DUF2157 domain-containing protein [Halopseudomonas sp. SMJS2]|uniref:DUF2157 domain-containing protein n=1 Tax=Halopseudomonas sp. SMJS2 TaxID=3041098 RepID=UPI002452907E|nr:DUF2157 domain-containing protein [Halopseudomonas sp. SMJS2]WGK60450.1 DUF2157 domain-containing protein [Halopseudomonas sp. SMJS2]